MNFSCGFRLAFLSSRGLPFAVAVHGGGHVLDGRRRPQGRGGHPSRELLDRLVGADEPEPTQGPEDEHQDADHLHVRAPLLAIWSFQNLAHFVPHKEQIRGPAVPCRFC